jgi:hypothetical protein
MLLLLHLLCSLLSASCKHACKRCALLDLLLS